MNRDKISAFTLRIASSNKTGLISVLYDIYEEYQNEAIDAFAAGERTEAVDNLKKCSEVVSHLKKDLNFNYSVSKDLYALYDYVQRCLSRSIYKATGEGVVEARGIMAELGEAFAQIAREDNSAPLMQNSQKVMAGMTYGRSSLNETFINNETNRGFWV